MNIPSRQRRRRLLALGAIPTIVLIALFGVISGSVHVPLSAIWQTLIGEGDAVYDTIVWDLRLPRVLTGLLTGACLASSGALLQGVMRNSLADPGIIGVSAGGDWPLLSHSFFCLNTPSCCLPSHL